jgi:hypothetical protein
LSADSVWRIRWTDFLVIGGLVVCGTLGMWGGGRSPKGGIVEIRGRDGAVRVPLDGAVQTFRVSGPLGQTQVEIRDGAARVVDSPCRDKVCVKMGWVRGAGEWAACVPNRVLLRVEARPGLDAVTR